MTTPNILWYCTDQQRFDTIAALGNPHITTPAIDGLVRSGVSFTHTYCQSPICTPSRSSFMTGLYPSKLHNTRNGNDTFPSWPPLISRLLADAGYACGLVGKFHLVSSGHRPEPRLDDGFTTWQHSHAPRDDWPEGTHDYADWVRAQGKSLDEMRSSEERVDPELHQTKWATDRAIEFLERADDTPWMLNINVYDPHPPFIPPQAFAERVDAERLPGPHFRAADIATQTRLAAVDFQGGADLVDLAAGREIQALYYAMILQIDEQLARLLAALDRLGMAEDTVVIFTSDHGEMLGDHGLVQKGCRFYEGLVRVPLIFSCPGRFQTDLQCGGLVELLDLSATILDLAGVPLPAYHQGQSLVDVLAGTRSGERLRPFVRSEYFDALDKEFVGGNESFATMYRDERYKLCLYHDVCLGELYDLAEDPWEHEDLWDSAAHQGIKHALIEQSFHQHVMLTTDVGSKRIAPM